MLPKNIADTVPENQFSETHETLSSTELVPPKSIQERMRRDPEFRFHMEEHL